MSDEMDEGVRVMKETMCKWSEGIGELDGSGGGWAKWDEESGMFAMESEEVERNA